MSKVSDIGWKQEVLIDQKVKREEEHSYLFNTTTCHPQYDVYLGVDISLYGKRIRINKENSPVQSVVYRIIFYKTFTTATTVLYLHCQYFIIYSLLKDNECTHEFIVYPQFVMHRTNSNISSFMLLISAVSCSYLYKKEYCDK